MIGVVIVLGESKCQKHRFHEFKVGKAPQSSGEKLGILQLSEEPFWKPQKPDLWTLCELCDLELESRGRFILSSCSICLWFMTLKGRNTMRQNTEKNVDNFQTTQVKKSPKANVNFRLWDNHAKTSQTQFSNYALYRVLAHCGKKKLVLAISRKISQKYGLTHEFWKYSNKWSIIFRENNEVNGI